MASTVLRCEAPKVVQIETCYVQTDAINFKDVVQSFTGKNSSTAWIGRRNNNNNNADQSSYDVVLGNSEIQGGTAINAAKREEGDKPSMLMRNMSIKDFDTLFLELPPMEIDGTLWF